MLQILLPVALVFVLSFLANRHLVALLPQNIYLVLMFPGVVIHELSHYSVSVLTGTPVHSVQFFSRTGGHIVHGQPKIPVVGQLFISFAPLVIGIALSVFLISHLPIEAGNAWQLTLGKFKVGIPEVTGHWGLFDFIKLYLLFSIIMTLTPSRQDITASSAGIIVLFIVLYILKLNGWLYYSFEAINFLWYINACLAVIVLGAYLLKLILNFKGG
mgnify:CR=1 FL=1